jgi:aspartate racemase
MGCDAFPSLPQAVAARHFAPTRRPLRKPQPLLWQTRGDSLFVGIIADVASLTVPTIEKMMNAIPHTRSFGLVAGLGVGAGMFYYKALVEAHLARGLSAKLLMVHADARYVMRLAAAGEAQALANYLAGLLQQLARGGAVLASIPAFAPQVCAAELSAMTPLPLVDLLDVVALEVERLKLRRVALLGARVTMDTRMFGRLPNVSVVMPAADELDSIADLYVKIVDAAYASEADYQQLRTLAHTLIERDNLDAIVLAGTDLAFVFNPSNTDFAHVDCARVHIEAIMEEILREG